MGSRILIIARNRKIEDEMKRTCSIITEQDREEISCIVQSIKNDCPKDSARLNGIKRFIIRENLCLNLSESVVKRKAKPQIYPVR